MDFVMWTKWTKQKPYEVMLVNEVKQIRWVKLKVGHETMQNPRKSRYCGRTKHMPNIEMHILLLIRKPFQRTLSTRTLSFFNTVCTDQTKSNQTEPSQTKPSEAKRSKYRRNHYHIWCTLCSLHILERKKITKDKLISKRKAIDVLGNGFMFIHNVTLTFVHLHNSNSLNHFQNVEHLNVSHG